MESSLIIVVIVLYCYVLYNKEDFASQGIILKFIRMGDINIDAPYASILDLLFRYDKKHLKNELNKYTLI